MNRGTGGCGVMWKSVAFKFPQEYAFSGWICHRSWWICKHIILSPVSFPPFFILKTCLGCDHWFEPALVFPDGVTLPSPVSAQYLLHLPLNSSASHGKGHLFCLWWAYTFLQFNWTKPFFVIFFLVWGLHLVAVRGPWSSGFRIQKPLNLFPLLWDY